MASAALTNARSMLRAARNIAGAQVTARKAVVAANRDKPASVTAPLKARLRVSQSTETAAARAQRRADALT